MCAGKMSKIFRADSYFCLLLLHLRTEELEPSSALIWLPVLFCLKPGMKSIVHFFFLCLNWRCHQLKSVVHVFFFCPNWRVIIFNLTATVDQSEALLPPWNIGLNYLTLSPAIWCSSLCVLTISLFSVLISILMFFWVCLLFLLFCGFQRKCFLDFFLPFSNSRLPCR